jgi:hypothetical protein
MIIPALKRASILELMMKTTLTTLSIAASVAAAFSLPAAATSAEQVRAELERAFDRGNLGTQRNGEFVERPAFEGSKSREQVNAELERTFDRGNLISQRNGEFVQFPSFASSTGQEQTGEEAIRAAQSTGESAVRSGS